MLAGSNMTRITVASMNTATAKPKPNCCRPRIRLVAKAANTPTITAAALVI